MRRISIDVTPEEHRRLKALAALQGKTIKDFVLERTLGAGAVEDAALSELEAILEERLQSAKSAESSRTVEDILQEVKDEQDHGSRG